MGGKCKTEPECTLHPLLPQVNRSPGHDDDENDDVDDDDDDNDDDNDVNLLITTGATTSAKDTSRRSTMAWIIQRI